MFISLTVDDSDDSLAEEEPKTAKKQKKATFSTGGKAKQKLFATPQGKRGRKTPGKAAATAKPGKKNQ